MDINLGGMFLCAKEAGRRMKAQGGGVILMTASSNGTEGHRWYADYNASKAGVILLTKTLALELAPSCASTACAPVTCSRPCSAPSTPTRCWPRSTKASP